MTSTNPATPSGNAASNSADITADHGRDHRRVTIGDVAERAGVSIATVSRAVNQKYGVSPKTVDKVREVIDELGYESSLVARSLRNTRTNVIGILVPGIDPFGAELLKGAARAMQETDFELVVYAGGLHGESGWERRYLSRLSGTLTDGIILVAPTVLEVDATHPVVAVDPHLGASTVPSVDSQNFEGAQAATRHLLDLGHRRIGFLAGRSDLESARRREAGYRSALADAGVSFDPTLIQAGGFTEETSEVPALTLLSLADRPTAIFAANDLSAIQVLRTATQLGLSVPDDLSVVGFDNIPESAMTDPPLTTVDQSIQSLGEEAVRILVDLIERPDRAGRVAHTTLPTSLVVRKSCRRLEQP
ncbi:MAG: LacI family DNA-binding transcriptional regulator [Ilumatobacter sp.]|uniref:LacI family DNA-binding transcriptional regulator n=1 Tax=Ilumatobacter sp. TaxID=1967498 RepID=UPI003C74EE89